LTGGSDNWSFINEQKTFVPSEKRDEYLVEIPGAVLQANLVEPSLVGSFAEDVQTGNNCP